MTKDDFKFILAKSEVRKLNKRQYKEVMSWLRKCRNIVAKALPANELIKAVNTKILFGA